MAPVPGYWGEITSTIDWCEDNYVISRYIAEFWNTLSNLVMIVAPLYACILAVQQRVEKVYIFSYLAITAVGCGSWLFHMTLKYSMQLLDELPMIWGSSVLLYAIITIEEAEGRICLGTAISLLGYSIVVTIVYLVYNDPLFHEVAYAVLVIAMVLSALRILIKFREPVSQAVYAVAFCTYAAGFLLWNVDNYCCGQLRSLRRSILPTLTSHLSQCHAWWHILAGIGTYMSLVFVLYTRYYYLKKSPRIKAYVWVSSVAGFVLP